MLLKMKFKLFKISICMISIFMLPPLCFGDEVLKGDAFYAGGKYKEAVISYQSVIAEGYQSAGLFYNLGNAYFKSGDIASALLYYEKAHLLSPGDEDINLNIRFANSKTTDKIDEAPEFFLAKWWTGFILAISADSLAILAVVLMLLASAFLIVYFFSKHSALKKVSFFSALGVFFLGLFSVFVAHSQVSYFNDNKQAIVFSTVANVKSSPAGQSATLFVLHEGTKVAIKETNGDWIKIKLANGNEGWLKVTDLKQI
jgi:tetratricopeptide (TPR) repeat protein